MASGQRSKLMVQCRLEVAREHFVTQGMHKSDVAQAKPHHKAIRPICKQSHWPLQPATRERAGDRAA